MNWNQFKVQYKVYVLMQALQLNDFQKFDKINNNWIEKTKNKSSD